MKTYYHMSYALRYFNRLSDAELVTAVLAPPKTSATEIRKYLADLKKKGIEFLLPPCTNHDGRGECLGHENEEEFTQIEEETK